MFEEIEQKPCRGVLNKKENAPHSHMQQKPQEVSIA